MFGGQLISMNISPRKEEGFYTYSIRMARGTLCLAIGVNP
jgi:hypothetical protein